MPPRRASAKIASAASWYQCLAAWIDIFDAGAWERPAQMTRRLCRRGVSTVFVQTSNHRHPRAVHRPGALSRMLGSAHRHGMRVVAWYLPGFDDPQRDWRRIRAAVTYAGEGASAGAWWELGVYKGAEDGHAEDLSAIPASRRRAYWAAGTGALRR